MTRLAHNSALTHNGEGRCNIIIDAPVPRRGTVPVFQALVGAPMITTPVGSPLQGSRWWGENTQGCARKLALPWADMLPGLRPSDGACAKTCG